MPGRERRCLGQFTRSPGQACCSRSFPGQYRLIRTAHPWFLQPFRWPGDSATQLSAVPTPADRPPRWHLPLRQTLNVARRSLHLGSLQSGSEPVADQRQAGRRTGDMLQRMDRKGGGNRRERRSETEARSENKRGARVGGLGAGSLGPPWQRTTNGGLRPQELFTYRSGD